MENKTMDEYTIYCTEDQTRKALALGAQIKTKKKSSYDCDGALVRVIYENQKPTTEQMCEWLRRENGLFVEPYLNGECSYSFSPIVSTIEDGEIIRLEAEDGYKEALLAAIDAALDYLTNNKKTDC